MDQDRSAAGQPGTVRTYLQLIRLLDGIEHDHPEVSAPLRLQLLRARREGAVGALDADSFRAAAAECGWADEVSA